MDSLTRLLLSLLIHSKEITTAIVKESTSGYSYDNDPYKQYHVKNIRKNISTTINRIMKFHTKKGNYTVSQARFCLGMCLSSLYLSLKHIGTYLDIKTLSSELDLKYLHTETVLALIVNAADIMQTILCNMLLHNKDKRCISSKPVMQATQILEVVNGSVNMLQFKITLDFVNCTVVFRTAGEINLLNRLVTHFESFALCPLAAKILQDLIKNRIWALHAQLMVLMVSFTTDSENSLLCRIAASMLLYYRRVVLRTLYSPIPVKSCYENGSLAFYLMSSLSLALRTRMLSCDKEIPYYQKNEVVYSGIQKNISRICDDIYASITAYHKQLLLQEILKPAAHYDYNTCLDYAESALQKAQALRSSTFSPGEAEYVYLQMLEKSLTKFRELCALTLLNKATSPEEGPNSKLDDAYVVRCFCNMNGAELWNLIDEEMCL